MFPTAGMFFPEQEQHEAEKNQRVEILMPVDVREDIRMGLIVSASMVAEEKEMHCDK